MQPKSDNSLVDIACRTLKMMHVTPKTDEDIEWSPVHKVGQ